MTTKHTPGPWIVDHDDTCLPNHVGITARGARRHRLLAQVVWKMEDEERSPEKEANARLIAAAPEMLKTLQGIAETPCTCTYYGGDVFSGCPSCDAKTVVARAT